MSLIFDRFPSREKAEEFLASMRTRYKARGAVFDSQEVSEDGAADPNCTEERDVFPGRLDPPIVLIERGFGPEPEIQEAAESFGGEFAGT